MYKRLSMSLATWILSTAAQPWAQPIWLSSLQTTGRDSTFQGPLTRQYRKIGNWKKKKFIFSIENNSMLTSFGKKFVTLQVTIEILKLVHNASLWWKKLNFHFLFSPIVGLLPPHTKHQCQLTAMFPRIFRRHAMSTLSVHKPITFTRGRHGWNNASTALCKTSAWCEWP